MCKEKTSEFRDSLAWTIKLNNYTGEQTRVLFGASLTGPAYMSINSHGPGYKRAIRPFYALMESQG